MSNYQLSMSNGQLRMIKIPRQSKLVRCGGVLTWFLGTSTFFPVSLQGVCCYFDMRIKLIFNCLKENF
jgi:hypothetical protein